MVAVLPDDCVISQVLKWRHALIVCVCVCVCACVCVCVCVCVCMCVCVCVLKVAVGTYVYLQVYSTHLPAEAYPWATQIGWCGWRNVLRPSMMQIPMLSRGMEGEIAVPCPPKPLSVQQLFFSHSTRTL